MPFGLALDSFPMQVLLGLYLGVLTGIVPALVCFAFGFSFKYVTGLTIPGLGVVVLGVAIAGINGGLMAFNDPTILQSSNSVAVITGLVVVLMLCFYAHAQGDKLGASLPKHFSFKRLRERTLSKDVVDFVGGIGQVRVPVVGTVADMEGYPPLPADLREEITAVDWTFPADLPLHELERRFEERLRSEFDVADADVQIDEQARATVTVAPPLSGVSKRVPQGKRAVSLKAVIPTGVARGDEVALHTAAGSCTGTVVAAKSGGKKEEKKAETPTVATDGGTPEAPAKTTAPVTTGGEGRITVATDRASAETLLDATEGTVVVTARGTRREFELLSLLRRTGNRMRRVTLRIDGPLDGTTIGETNVREVYGVAILAVRHDGQWVVAPRGDTALSGGDDCFVVGPRDKLSAFAEAVA
ncbi:potassium channel family protein [Halarchaeum sp. P4]|uniref:potassium channel family protein n=1 Tax=Halarchaeum sp. P4 TaxID=3421639 RepID=UPI003EC15707